MKSLVRGWSVLTVTALMVACVSQRDSEREVAQNAATPPNSSQNDPSQNAPSAGSSHESAVLPVVPPIVIPEVDSTFSQPAGEQRRREMAKQQSQSMDLGEVTVTGSRVSRAERQAVMVSGVTAHSPAITMNAPAGMCCQSPIYQQTTDTERYQHLDENPVHRVADQPVSTFSIDVDTGAYANVRRFLNEGQLPPQDAVRVEEMINYFDYQYTPPATRETPFRVATELAPAPWNSDALLLKIGIKGFEIAAGERPAANLVFLIDVSGSMQSPDKLPLLKNAFRLLTDQLTARDRVSMVVYAGSSGVVLEPTPGDQKHKIREAIDRLEAGGSTNGAEGIERAYQLATAAHIAKGINRVVLATDGDFNVGVVNFEALVDMAQRQRTSGTALTTLGFGTGNYNDQLLERLADAGNGNYAYVDSLSEARKVLVSELAATLFTIAKDVKIQVEFNPAEVLEYRLIGYENRMLAREDFNNDKVDAGEIGAGHRVTALYEVIPAGAKGRIDPLRYGHAQSAAIDQSKVIDQSKPIDKSGRTNGELANVRLRYKRPDAEQSQLLEYPILKSSMMALEKTSPDLRFAASVAAFGQLLRGGKYLNDYGYDQITALAQGALRDDLRDDLRGDLSGDSEGYRREFVSLVKLANALTPQGKRVEQVGELAR